MSRSYRKTPICGFTTCDSEKQYKRDANRKARVEMRRRMSKFESDEIDPVDIREVSSVWSFGKDGKQYFGNLEGGERLWRK